MSSAAASRCDEWLKRRALPNQLGGASRTLSWPTQTCAMSGYYAMAAGAVSHQAATNAVRRNMPDPVQVVVLAGLAVDHRAKDANWSGALLQDAVNRAITVSPSTPGFGPSWSTRCTTAPSSSTGTMGFGRRRCIR